MANESIEYYLLQNNGLNPISLDSEKYDWRDHCQTCKEPKILSLPSYLPVQDTRLGRCPLNMIQTFSRIAVIRQDLLDFLPEEAANCLVIGKVTGGNGRLLSNWHSFFSANEVIVRGTTHVKVRRCDECGYLFYFALGHEHLCPRPPAGIPLFHAGFGRLVVTSYVYQKLKNYLHGKLSTTHLTITDDPIDGLERTLG